jgi:hypothetical protein
MAIAEHVCGRCGHDFCPECVVFPHGVQRPPMCITCALELGGVRRRGTDRPPKMSRRAVKKRLKEHQRTVRKPVPVEAAVEPEPSYDEEKWMHGVGSAEDFPGGWKQEY